MVELKALLIALIKGDGSFEAASARIDALLRESPALAADCARMLQAARKAGLPQNVYAALKGRIGTIPASRPGGFPQTVVLQRPTVLSRAPEHSAAGADPDITMLATDDPDVTILAPEDHDPGAEPTLLAQGCGDATEIAAADGDVTELPYIETGSDPREARTEVDDGEPTSGERAGFGTATRGRPEVVSDEPTELGAGDTAGDSRLKDETAVNAGIDDRARAATVNRGTGSNASTMLGARRIGIEESTTVNPDAGDEDFDILDPEAMEAAEHSGPDTGADWATNVGELPNGAGFTREFCENDRLRARFELISKLGEGGMGAVWKGRDLLKVEARDRNPFVAIKLLQGDFKGHPEAFIALQRETSKQQRLAHPNIATVYDFDRDDATQTVFMTMEVLEGQPLDAFVRKLPADGLPQEEAMPLIEQLCAGLGYAHGHGLVHSDLKPGNVFLTRDGAVKLLDFGIARASKTKSDAEGETTLFDPGQLGALTPTYATLEMFDGKDPDPRDDIYALAIMSYQLLAGRHPYGKKSAPKALELGLVPDPVEKLSKAQNRGLARGLALHREERTPSVEEFIEELKPRQSRSLLYAGSGIAAAAVIAALSIGPITDYLNERKRDEIAKVCAEGGIAGLRECVDRIQAWDDPEQRGLLFGDARVQKAVLQHIARGDEQSITEGLDVLVAFAPEVSKDIREAPTTRDAVLDLYQARIAEVFAPTERRYDYPAARKVVDELASMYRDSARVLNIRNGIKAEQQAELSALGDRYEAFFDAGQLVPQPGEDDIGDALALIRALDPEHRLLSDDRLRFRFAELAGAALEIDDLERASALLEASVEYAPDDPELAELRFEVNAELERAANARRVEDIQSRLESELASLRSLDDFQRVRDDLLVLTDLSPGNAVLSEIREELQGAFARALSARIAARDWAGGERLLEGFARLLEIPELAEQRLVLSAAENAAGYTRAEDAARAAAIEERRDGIETLLAEPEFSGDWERRLRVPYKELIALLPAGDPRLEPVRTAIADTYMARAARARETGRFAEALALIGKGQVFFPGLERLEAEEQRVAAAREELRLQRAEAQRVAGIRAAKDEFRTKAENDQIREAKEVLAGLRGERLEANDTFLAGEAPALLGEAYMRLAEAQAAADNLLDALTLARAGLEVAPRLAPLSALAAAYETEVQRRQRELALRRQFDSVEALDVDTARAELGRLREESPGRYESLVGEFSAARARQLENLANARSLALGTLGARLGEYAALFPTEGEAVDERVAGIVEKRLGAAAVDEPKRITALGKPLAEFRDLFPARHRAVVARLAERSAAVIAARAGKNRGEAYRLLVASKTTFGDHAALAALSGLRPPPKELLAAIEAIDAAKLTAARKSLDRARARDAGHPDLADVEARLSKAEQQARARYATYAAAVNASKTPRDQKRFDTGYAAITRLWGDNPDFSRLVVRRPQKGECTSELAGYGLRRGGTCYDLIGKRKGPEMVVVPPGGGVGAPFAIGKYEVTVDDFNLFCKETQSCMPRPPTNRRLPITGISLSEAEQYAAWLSQRASTAAQGTVVYRLPTATEWEYAALADGEQPEKKFNCRVTSGASIIAGHALVDARSGKPNGWGLTNYVGNAQEWARAGGSVVARGGAFEDPLAKCEASISRNHSGGADEVTGFRLVRELG